MAWKFAFEILLKERIRQRDMRLRALSDAQSGVNTLEDKIFKMNQNIQRSREKIVDGEGSGPRSMIGMDLTDEYIQGQKILIRQKREELRQQKLELEEAEWAFVEANKQVKVLEKLKEKQWLIYKKDKQKKEMKQIDNMNIMKGRK